FLADIQVVTFYGAGPGRKVLRLDDVSKVGPGLKVCSSLPIRSALRDLLYLEAH
ncbi:hypothetical protein CHS0354_016998, partial [Potamilus streckersoni]